MVIDEKKRNVFLFGAGAVLDWKAPCTAELTKLVCEIGFFIKGSDTRITEFIFNQLQEVGKYNEKDINFETIINVIEELIVYYSLFNVHGKTSSLLSVFLAPKFEEQLLNFTMVEGLNGTFMLHIPKFSLLEGKHPANDVTPPQFFFQLLLAELLSVIVNRVGDYAYHSKNHSNIINRNHDINNQNQLFLDWIKKVNGNNTLRMYTLNYDSIFKVILENQEKSISIFDGFTCDKNLEYSNKYPANIKKILTDKESNVHYNLHGSAFWGLQGTYGNDLHNPIFYLQVGPFLPVNSYEQTSWQSEKGKTIMLTNIITGYQKTQRGILSPFKQMQASFDYDCCFADTIYIVGYSFNDEHINSSVKTAAQYNEHVKIVIVDPSFTQNDNDVNIAMKIFSCAGDRSLLHPKTVEKNVHSFYDGKFIVHTKKFKEYMYS